MTKIMLVEDDKSLREIYGVRLLAEGYDIVSAGDGEEALAMAIKERPQLIVSDVMMPKISGFDMLDILRSTTETKNIKVIMMTALSSEEQRTRGESLGADRYLVKSQVGIEDVVHVVHEVLGDQPSSAPAPAPIAPVASPQPTSATPLQSSLAAAPPAAQPVTPAVNPVPAQPSAPAPTQPPTSTVPTGSTTLPHPMDLQSSVPAPTPATTAPSPTPLESAPASGTTPRPSSQRARIIQPLNDPTQSTVDLNKLLDQELAKEAGANGDVTAPVTLDQEKALVNEQIASFTPPVVAAAPTTVFTTSAGPAAASATPASVSSVPTPITVTSAPAQTPPTATATAPAPTPAPANVPEITISEDGAITPEQSPAGPTASTPKPPTSS